MDMSTATAAQQSANLHKYTYDNRLYQWHINAFLDTLNGFVAQADPTLVLDAGCGEGFVTQYIAERNPDLKITGVDLSREAIEYAKEHFGEKATFRTGSVYKLPFSDKSFDLVVCSEVLEHLDEPLKALQELKRVSRKHVLITVPREPYFKWLNDLGQLLGTSPDPGHVNFWTKETFEDFITTHFSSADFARRHVIYQLALAEI